MKLILSFKSLWLILKWSLYPCGLLHFAVVRETQIVFLLCAGFCLLQLFPSCVWDALQMWRILWINICQGEG